MASQLHPLRKLYSTLNAKLGDEKEREIKNLLRDKQLYIREIEKQKNVAEIFLCLEEKGFISETDLSFMKTILRGISTPGLVKDVVKCEKELGIHEDKASTDDTDLQDSDEFDGPKGNVDKKVETQGKGKTKKPQLGKAKQVRHRSRKQKDYTDLQDPDEVDGPKGNVDQQAKTQRKAFWKFGIGSMIFVLCVLAYIYIPIGQENTKTSPFPEPRLKDDEQRIGHKEIWNMNDNDKENTIQGHRSVLFLNDEWGTSKGGISSVNRQLALQAKKAGYAVYVTVLARPSEEDQKDAEEKGIKLIIADTIPGVDQEVNLKMVNEAHERYFPSLEKDIANLNVIVGHVPITSKGALDIKKKRFPNTKIFLFTHVIPDETEFHKHGYFNLGKTEANVENIKRQAEQADVVFSVGPKVYKQFRITFRSSTLDDEKHKEFIPIPDEIFFNLNLKPFSENDPYEILSVGRVSNVENLKGYDIVAAALGRVATKRSMFDDMLGWRIRGISEKDVNESIEFIMNNLEKVNGKFLKLRPMLYGTQKQVSNDIEESRLFLMPSRTEPFGMVGLEAIAAGIPVLVTANSGLADFLKEHFPKHMCDSMIVSKLGKTDIDTDGDIVIWEDRITDVLFNKYKDTFDLARQVQGKLTELKSHSKSQIFKDELKKLK